MEKDMECTTCHEEKAESEYYRQDDKPKRICKVCENITSTKRKLKLRTRRKAHIDYWKMHNGCSACDHKALSSSELELHHVNGNKDKINGVAHMIHTRTIKAVIEEIRKCVILCRPCHQEAHRIIKQQEA